MMLFIMIVATLARDIFGGTCGISVTNFINDGAFTTLVLTNDFWLSNW